MFLNLLVNTQILAMQLMEDRRGVTAVEYAIIAVAVSALVLAVFTNGDLKAALTDAMSSVKANVSKANTVPSS